MSRYDCSLPRLSLSLHPPHTSLPIMEITYKFVLKIVFHHRIRGVRNILKKSKTNFNVIVHFHRQTGESMQQSFRSHFSRFNYITANYEMVYSRRVVERSPCFPANRNTHHSGTCSAQNDFILIRIDDDGVVLVC